MSKLKAGRVAVWVTERAIRSGRYGYTAVPVERMRGGADLRHLRGTEQIQQLVISRAISGLRVK